MRGSERGTAVPGKKEERNMRETKLAQRTEEALRRAQAAAGELGHG